MKICLRKKVWVLAILEKTRCLSDWNLKTYNDSSWFARSVTHSHVISFSLGHLWHFVNIFRILIISYDQIFTIQGLAHGESLPGAFLLSPARVPSAIWPRPRGEGRCFPESIDVSLLGTIPTHSVFAFCYFSSSAFPVRKLSMEQPIWTQLPVDIFFVNSVGYWTAYIYMTITRREHLLNIRKLICKSLDQ